jgi:hypothetical protein
VEVVGSAALACVAWVRGVCSLFAKGTTARDDIIYALIGSSAVACVVCVRGGCNLLWWTRQREEILSMVVVGDGGGNGGDIGGGGGGDGMSTESNRVVQRERRHARAMSRKRLRFRCPGRAN